MQKQFSLENLLVLSLVILIIIIGIMIVMKFFQKLMSTLQSVFLIDRKIYSNLREYDLENDFNSQIVQPCNIQMIEHKMIDNCEPDLDTFQSYGYNYCRANNQFIWPFKYYDIGNRLHKYFFEIKQKIQSKTELRLVVFVALQNCKFQLDDLRVLLPIKQFLMSNQHPYIEKIIKFDIDFNFGKAIVVKHLHKFSLKDLIYKNKYPLKSYQNKYMKSGGALKISQIQKIGKCILSALDFLHSNKIYHNNIQTGNIYFLKDSDDIVLGELENYFLNNKSQKFQITSYPLKNKQFGHVKNPYEAIDIVQFGHILYEISTGQELNISIPDFHDYILIDKNIAEILSKIFPHGGRDWTISYQMNVEESWPQVSVNELLLQGLFQQSTNKEQTQYEKEYTQDFLLQKVIQEQ